MFLIFLGVLVVSQGLITLWKRFSPNSYNLTTLLGLWLLPLILSLSHWNTTFVLVWTLYSIVNTWVVSRALESPMKSSTPKLVYAWYARMYDLTYGLGLIGYVLFMLPLMQLPALFGASFDTESAIFDAGSHLLFYGLYFGTLSRDFCDRLSDRMATTMGYYSKTGFPSKHLRENTCAICGVNVVLEDDPIKLECRHTFHPACIRGWIIVGKKDSCPYCKEKTDLKQFQRNPWETTQQSYLQLLDIFRFILVWNPLVFLIVHYIYRFFRLK